MRQVARRYWVELLVFGAVFGVLMACNLPAMTWMNTDSDGPHYILSAKYMGVAHNTSAPMFLLLGRLFLFLPFGTEAWRMGLISVLATTGCTVLIYMVVRYHLTGNPKARIYALIASLIYGGSALVISQSTIIETYALATMLSVWAYYCALKRNWILVSVLIGLIWAIHTLFAWTIWVVLFIKHKELRNVVLVIITLAFLAFYAYIPIVTAIGNVPTMWGNTSFVGFFENQWGVLWMLTGGLAISDLPKRILDTLGILGVSFGFGFIILVIGLWKIRKRNIALVCLTLIPVIYFITNLATQTYVYLLPAVAYGAIVVGIGLSKLNMKWSYAVGSVAVVLLVFNANYLDIGRTLDPNLSAQKFYDEELPKIKDGEIYLGSGWTWAIVYLYNIEEGRNIIPICIDILPSKEYRGLLRDQGINCPSWQVTDGEMSHIDLQWKTALAIAQDNPNVWTSRETIPSQYEYEVVPAKDNLWLLTRWMGYDEPLDIAWKPSNPYDFITGAIEVSEWKFILKSTHNCRFLLTWAVFGFFVYWLALKAYDKRKKKA